MTIIVNDIDNHDAPMAMIETKTTTAKQIQDIIDDIKCTVEDYNTDDIIDRLPEDCKWQSIEGDAAVYF